MPSGLEEGAALVSLIGFSAAAFKGCVEGIFLLSRARNYGRNVSGVSLMIEFELHKLYSWGNEVGLLRDPQVLLVDAHHVAIVCKTLQHLNDLVSNLEKLSTTHGVHLQEEEDYPLRMDDVETALERMDTEHGSQSLVRTIFEKRSKPWKVLRWVAYEEKKAQNLLDSIRRFTHDLQYFLDQARQVKIMKAVDIILRNVVLNTASEQDLKMIGLLGQPEASIAAAARFKEQALLLGIMDRRQAAASARSRNDSVISPPERKASYPPINPRYDSEELGQMRLHCKNRLQIRKRSGNENRIIAFYDKKPVLLEFRSKTGLKLELEIDRVSKVSLFLTNLDPSFHGLSCLGFVQIFDQFAYVFSLPEVPSPSVPLKRTETQQRIAYRSLRDLLDNIPTPPLNLRLTLSTILLETLLQLHTSSWLHKELRSDNLLFFLATPSSFSSESDFLKAEMQVTGYAHARADQPLDPMTQSIESELESNLYRHPASLRQPRKFYRRAFDMFSVGCVLIELGIWGSLFSLCCEEYGPQRNAQQQPPDVVNYMRIRDELLRPESEKLEDVMSEKVSARLSASAGRKYTGVVKKLLHTSAEGDATLATVADSLEALRSLADAL